MLSESFQFNIFNYCIWIDKNYRKNIVLSPISTKGKS